MTTLDERRTLRRAALLDAGIALLGAEERPAVSVRAVCTRASLTERYFYESFADRDTFVRTVYEEVAGAARAALIAAVGEARTPGERSRRAVAAFVELVIDEPARGRVLLKAPFADVALNRLGPNTVPLFVALVEEHLPARVTGVDRRLAATAMVGALTALFTSYLDGDLNVDRDRFVDHCVSVVTPA